MAAATRTYAIRGDVAGLDPSFRARLQAFIDGVVHEDVYVFSGRRSSSHNAAVGGVPGSEHLSGDAVDARTASGKPLGTVAAPDVFARFGLITGNVAGFFRGGRDPSHVQLSADTSSSSSSSTTGSSMTVGDAYSAFVTGVSKQTGLDPRVIVAWVKAEGAYAKGGTGGLNFLNLRPAAGDVGVVATSAGGFDQFGTVQDAITSTVNRLNQPFAAGILRASHSSPGTVIHAIAASGWDAGHYGGNGQTLIADITALFGKAVLHDRYQGPDTAAAVAATAGTGDANLPWYEILNVPGDVAAGAAEKAGKAVASWAAPLTNLIGNLLSGNFWRRAGLLILGVVMILAGVGYLARSQVTGAVAAAARG